MENFQIKDKKIKLRGVLKYVYKQMGKAILDYHMIEDADRILVAFWADPKSFSLVKLFKMRKRRVPIKFDFFVCLVNTGMPRSAVEAINNYFFDEQINFTTKSVDLGNEEPENLWCSLNVRKVLYTTAMELGCNKIALSDVLDDIAETIVTNLCLYGKVEGMEPQIELFKEKLVVIRPLCYVERKDIYNFFSKLEFPKILIPNLCQIDSKKEEIRKILRELEKNCPYVKKNIFNALKNVKDDYLL